MEIKEVVILIFDVFILQVKMVLLMFTDLYDLIWPEEKNISGKLVLITGAGGHLGRELAIQLGKQGAVLVLWDIDQSTNEETASIVHKAGGEAHTYTCDVSNYKDVAETAKLVRKSLGNPTYVFSNAGIYYFKSFFEHTPEEIEKLVNINLLGNMWMSKEFLGSMMDSNNGHFIFISSILGYVGRPNVVPYCASKWGVKGLTEALSEEVRMERRSGVVITAVHPFLISNVTDVQVNVRLPFLFEVLTPSDAASRIIRGVLRNHEEIFLPEKLQPFLMMSKILPRSLRRITSDFMEN